MFRALIIHTAHRISDVIDEMLVGDFDYIDADGVLYADVDYYRSHPHRGTLHLSAARRPDTLCYSWETKSRAKAAVCGYQESVAF